MSALHGEPWPARGHGGGHRDPAADPAAEEALLRRMVAGLGVRLVALADQRQLVVSNLSVRLTADEAAVLARVIRGG